MVEDSTTLGWLDEFLRIQELHLTLVGVAGRWSASIFKSVPGLGLPAQTCGVARGETIAEAISAALTDLHYELPETR